MKLQIMIKTLVLVQVLFLKNEVSSNTKYCQYRNGIADCSHQKLTAVPSYLKRSIFYLDISYNDISVLHNRSFESLLNLTILDVSNNMLQYIDIEAFYGLNKLTDIRLDHNMLFLDQISVDVFKEIPSLIKLKIYENTRRQSKTIYANIIGNLVNLEYIELDMFKGYVFEKEFQHLKRLHTCELHPASYDGFYFQRRTFRDFPSSQITSLIIRDVYNIDKDTFCNFTSLQELHIGYGIHYPLETVDRVFMSLDTFRYRNLTYLDIHHNTYKTSFRLGHQLTYIQRICLKELHLYHMYITDISSTAFEVFAMHSKCLETLYISDNTIYDPSIGLLLFLHLFQNLKSFHYENNNRKSISYSANRKLNHAASNHLFNPHIGIRLPTHLREFSLIDSELFQTYDGLSFMCAENLQRVILNIPLHSCTFQVTGIDKVKYLDLTKLGCERLDVLLVSRLSFLETLIFKNAGLGYGIKNNTEASLFLKENLNLKLVDLSSNSLSSHQITLFSHKFQNLRFINVSNNNFKTLPDCSGVKRLETLDLSFNAITALTSSNIETIRRIKLSTVYLKGNPFQCSCQSMYFLKWIKHTTILADIEDITCILMDGSQAKITQFVTQLEQFESNCESKFWLPFSVTLSTIIILCVLVGVIYFRYKHAFEYIFLIIKMRFKKYELLPIECEFDAFVSYSHHDVGWVKAFHDKLEAIGFNLCLDAKNFLPGDSIGENVVKAIDSSRKVIFIVTENFLKSSWGTYEMEMTRMHAFQKQRNNMVIVVMRDEIDMDEMPTVLKTMWYNIVCIKWPNDTTLPFETEDKFYEKLKHSLSS